MNKRIYVAIISYVLVVAIAEIITLHDPKKITGIYIDAILIFFLITHSSLERERDFSNLLKVLTIAPFMRVLSNSMPLLVIQPIYQFFIISIILLGAVFLLIKNQGIREKEVGFKWGDPRIQLMIALTGILFGYMEYNILKPKEKISVLMSIILQEKPRKKEVC